MARKTLHRREIIDLLGAMDDEIVDEIIALDAHPEDLLEVIQWLELDGTHPADSGTITSRKAMAIRNILLRDACEEGS